MPGGRGKIKPEDNTNGFQKNPENINLKGRPRKLIGTVNQELEEKGVKEASKQEILSCYLRLINLPEKELQEIKEDSEGPMLSKIVAKNILGGKGFDVIERMLDRAVGKPDQKVEQKHSIDKDFDIKKVFGFDKAE